MVFLSLKHKSVFFILIGLAGAVVVGGGFVYFGQSALFVLLLLIGLTCFAPVGVAIGMLLADKYMRCRVYRLLTRRNYTIVNLVQQDGRNIASLLKNLDDDTLIQGNALWSLKNGTVFNETDVLDEAGLPTGEKKTVSYSLNDLNHIKTHGGVPEIFLNYDTFEPLDFFERKDAPKAKPREVGRLAQGYILTEMLKLLNWKRNIQLLLLAAVVFSLISAYFGYANGQNLGNKIDALDNRTAKIEAVVVPATLNNTISQPRIVRQAGIGWSSW